MSERASLTLRPRCPGFAIAAVGQALAVAVLLACSTPTTQAAGHRYWPVHVTDRTATFAVHELAGRTVISARLTATGAKSRRVARASVRRAASSLRTKRGLLRVSLPRSWPPARRAKRMGLTLHVRSRPGPGRPVSSGKVLWKADAESSLASEWASSSSLPAAAAPARPDASRIGRSGFRAQGRRSYRFKLRDGDESFGERAELGQALPDRPGDERRWFRAGQERWIAMQYYLPASWPTDNTWQTLFQIKPVSPGGGGPSIGFDAGRNRLMFYGNSNVWGSTAGKVFFGAGPLPGRGYRLKRSRWIKLTWHIVFSADPAVGSVEVFGNLANRKRMRRLMPRRSLATMKYLDGAMDAVHLRVGIYRDPAIRKTSQLFVDGITVAKTRAAAEANAYRSR